MNISRTKPQSLRYTLQVLCFIICLLQVQCLSGYAGQGPGIFLSTPGGDILMEQNASEPYIPASILKILTGFAAISHFDRDFRFSTLACFEEDSSILYIKGFGDPLFISEAIQKFCSQIAAETRIHQKGYLKKIVVDQSFFAPDIHIPGTGNSTNPYDAAVGALCANFNTVSFSTDPGTGKFISAEPQTPLVKECIPKIKSSGLKQGRILIPPAIQPVYPGKLVQYFLEQKGIQIKGPVITGKFPENIPEPVCFQSIFSIEEIVKKLLRYSNNLIANQLLLTMGAEIYGPPATIEKGTKVLQDFARKKIGIDLPCLVEGSGLSRRNKITPAQMGSILQHFAPEYSLLRETDRTCYKTGTLTGVRCLAGYIKGEKGSRYPFVIMINQKNPAGVPGILRKLIQKVDEYEKGN